MKKKELREPSAETFSTAGDWETNVKKCKELGVGGTLHRTFAEMEAICHKERQSMSLPRILYYG